MNLCMLFKTIVYIPKNYVYYGLCGISTKNKNICECSSQSQTLKHSCQLDKFSVNNKEYIYSPIL